MNDSIFTLFCTLGARLYELRKAPHPGGRGYGLHDGFVLACPGEVDEDGNVANKHVVGILAKDPANPNPDVVYRILNQPQYDRAGQVIGDSDEGWINASIFHFLDTTGEPTGQDAIDPANPICVHCGAPIQIGV